MMGNLHGSFIDKEATETETIRRGKRGSAPG